MTIRTRGRLQMLIEGAELIGAILVSLLMVGIFVSAIWKIWLGVSGLLAADEQSGLANVLKGIECFFLAPLVLLSYVTMVRFVHGHFQVTSMAVEGSAGETAPTLNLQEAVAHNIKLSVTSLMIAILLTDLVGKALDGNTKDWLNLVGESAAVALSLAYIFVLRRLVYGD